MRVVKNKSLERGGGSEFNKGWEKYRGSGGQKSQAGSRGRAPVGVWGQSPQKLETYAKSGLSKQATNATQGKLSTNFYC